ncbi:isocitrate lyase/phosphoenolpyruvate mutase family protein [Psychrobium sp. MM17-31]|uniref:isocitrate lyase/PEP mutase family protein n=1 Tax=Psychrobium sp. MM17-31 TaxID=2917758 RepID=UPI001EF3DD94|nr:isocitrate lyase/phosphoenolpyruvate mutase family protein [Psychrobium sp. MM17-31]MCG7530277.1 isocitrate lyase/phosphoenolpyruvate mutase family protein [Psychrobium sp. MM17-31]
MNFKQLHQQDDALLLCNVWDVTSAKQAQALGFKAIGTSSAAIATSLGYQDGEAMDFATLRFMVERIANNTSLPLSVDIEAGFSENPLVVVQHIKTLVELGVVGVNIEDSVVTHSTNTRSLVDSELFAQRLEHISMLLKEQGVDVFINVRTDPFLLNLDNALEETLSRLVRYQAAGANGIFIPCITEQSDISACVASTSLPINVMCMPQLVDFETLSALGVKRISMGSFLHEKLAKECHHHFKTVLEQQSFTSVFSDA